MGPRTSETFMFKDCGFCNPMAELLFLFSKIIMLFICNLFILTFDCKAIIGGKKSFPVRLFRKTLTFKAGIVSNDDRKGWDTKLHMEMTNLRMKLTPVTGHLPSLVCRPWHTALLLFHPFLRVVFCQRQVSMFLFIFAIESTFCHLTVQHIKLLNILFEWNHMSEMWCVCIWRTGLDSVFFVSPSFSTPAFFILSLSPSNCFRSEAYSYTYFIQIGRVAGVKHNKLGQVLSDLNGLKLKTSGLVYVLHLHSHHYL